MPSRGDKANMVPGYPGRHKTLPCGDMELKATIRGDVVEQQQVYNVAVIGGSGYAGGELVRLLLDHPGANLTQVTSERNAGKFVRTVHPNLRKRTDMKFTSIEAVKEADVIFIALPHGVSMGKMVELRRKARIIIDLSSDFRLRDKADYPTWYGHPHEHPEMLSEFVYGIPELHREEIRNSDLISSAGCMATTTILGLWPLYKAGVADLSKPIVVEAKTGSSGSGGSPGLGSHHPERSGVIRSFKPTGHRHSTEVIQELTVDGRAQPIAMSVTSVEAVSGIHRNPEPKILTGSNYCDVGFERDPHSNRVVVLAAIDNLMKGAAGQAVHSMNIRCGFPETASLEFAGLHPV